MAVRKPLVYVNGVRSELPVGDSVSVDFGWLTGKPTTLAGYGITDAVNLNGVQTVVGVKTFTDDIFITTTGASGGLVIDSPAGSLSEIWLRSGTSLRWSIRKSNEAESTGDAGSNLDFNSYTDAGTIKSRVARWNRNTGILDFTNMPTVGGAALYSLATAPTYYSNTSGYDVNNLTPGQRVTVGASVTNAPSSAGITYWYIECASTYLADGASRVQRAVSWDGAVSALRTLHSGTWTAWTYEWNSGNVTFSSAASSGTAVLRSSNGYIYANYINTTGGAQITTTAGSLWVETGNDGFHRRQTPAQFIANHSIATTTGGVEFNGEVITNAVHAYRQIYGNWGSFWRSDNSNLYLMLTNSGDQHGSWNALRPFTVTLATGAVSMNQGLAVGGSLDVTGGVVSINTGNGNGIHFWNSASYAIYMSSSADATYGGRAAGDPNSDYNMYFKMTSGTNRGFTFKNGSTVVGGISGSGVISDIKGDVRRTPAATSNAATQIVAAHVNTIVEKSNTTAYNYAINPDIGVQGDAITFVNSGTAGNLGILQGTGVTIVRNGTAGTVTVPPGSMVTCILSATANKWVCG